MARASDFLTRLFSLREGRVILNMEDSSEDVGFVNPNRNQMGEVQRFILNMCNSSSSLERVIGTDDPHDEEGEIKVYREDKYDKLWKREVDWCFETARFLWDTKSNDIYIWAGFAEHKMVGVWEGVWERALRGNIAFTEQPSQYVALLFGEYTPRMFMGAIKSIEKSTGYKVVAYV